MVLRTCCLPSWGLGEQLGRVTGAKAHSACQARFSLQSTDNSTLSSLGCLEGGVSGVFQKAGPLHLNPVSARTGCVTEQQWLGHRGHLCFSLGLQVSSAPAGGRLIL